MKIRGIILDETDRSLEFTNTKEIQRDDDLRTQSAKDGAYFVGSRNVWIRQMYLHTAILFGAGFFVGSIIGFLLAGILGSAFGLGLGALLSMMKIPFGQRIYVLMRRGDSRSLALVGKVMCPTCKIEIQRPGIEPSPYPADIFKKALKSHIPRDAIGPAQIDTSLYVIVGLVLAVIALAAALVIG